jgi:coniferyl-aldehyde dehydrogenase
MGLSRNRKMRADSPYPKNPVADAFCNTLQRHRLAYLAHLVPSLAGRRADLRQLERFVLDNRQAILAAVSAEFGHRSTHETLMPEFSYGDLTDRRLAFRTR